MVLLKLLFGLGGFVLLGYAIYKVVEADKDLNDVIIRLANARHSGEREETVEAALRGVKSEMLWIIGCILAAGACALIVIFTPN